MIGRIATFANASALITASLQVQANLADQQQQEASSLKSNSFSGLGTDAGSLLDVNGQVSRLKAEAAAATAAGSIVQTGYTAVGGILDLATNIRTQLSSALNANNGANGNSPVTTAASQAWLTDLQNELNTQVGGQYVFSGQAADRTPVNFSNPAYNPTAAPTTPDTSYYNGATSPRTLTTLDGSKIDISVTADSPGFEELARALSLMAANPTNNATLQQCFDMVGDAVSKIGQTQADLSNQAQSFDKLNTNDTDKSTTLTNIATGINGADITTAAVMVTQYQTQLQALYSTIGQLSQVSLLKYLTG
jgi:flagellar hook-associated protein 3 FlgL